MIRILDAIITATVWIIGGIEDELGAVFDWMERVYDDSCERNARRWCRRRLHCYISEDWPPWHEVNPDWQQPSAKAESVVLQARVRHEITFQFSSLRVER